MLHLFADKIQRFANLINFILISVSEEEIKKILTSARYQPKGIFLVAGLLATQMEKRDIINDAKSVNKCAASVAIAKLFDNTPPEEKKEKKENLCTHDNCLS